MCNLIFKRVHDLRQFQNLCSICCTVWFLHTYNTHWSWRRLVSQLSRLCIGNHISSDASQANWKLPDDSVDLCALVILRGIAVSWHRHVCSGIADRKHKLSFLLCTFTATSAGDEGLRSCIGENEAKHQIDGLLKCFPGNPEQDCRVHKFGWGCEEVTNSPDPITYALILANSGQRIMDESHFKWYLHCQFCEYTWKGSLDPIISQCFPCNRSCRTETVVYTRIMWINNVQLSKLTYQWAWCHPWTVC